MEACFYENRALLLFVDGTRDTGVSRDYLRFFWLESDYHLSLPASLSVRPSVRPSVCVSLFSLECGCDVECSAIVR